MRRIFQALFTLPFLLLASCLLASCSHPTAPNAPTTPGSADSSPNAGQPTLKIGYVLHGLNDFTQVIKRGAEDAAKTLGVEVEVVGPSSFDANEAIGMFEGMIQKKKEGLIAVPMPGDVWKRPIKEATDAKIPVATANITSEGSTADSWFGQDEYHSGVILADQIKMMLDANGKKSGTILVGICASGVAVLDERYKGFKKGMEGTGYTVTDPKPVGTENTANYSAWENQVTKYPDLVAAVGLCSMDIPNLAKLKVRTKGAWIIGGYDLNAETLDAIKAGTVQVSLGQHPYLQGYLPVLALVRHLRDNKPMPKEWVDVGTEIVTKQNVDALYARETNPAAETRWYADYITKNFSDLAPLAKPLPKTHP